MMRRGSNLRRGDGVVESAHSLGGIPGTSHALDQFVPRFARRLLPSTDLRESVSERASGVVVVADLVGFTPLTEQLAQRGQDGIERIQQVLNSCFARLVETVDAHGGEVVKFAGDAAIAWWPATTEALGATAQRVAETAFALHRITPELERDAGAPLRLRVSLAAGNCWTALVGGENGRWEALLGGELFEQFATIRGLGVGEVGCSSEMWALLGDSAVGEALEGGGWRLAGTPGTPGTPGSRSGEQGTGSARLSALVPRHLVARLSAGQQQHWIAELRAVSVLFGTVPALRGAALDAAAAHRITALMQRGVYTHGGSVVQAIVDDRGEFVFVAAWGVPGSSYSDNAERAVRAARAMSDELQADTTASIGVASGQVFSGLRGGATRLEYALIGRVVNLAARLMRVAEGRVLCDAETVHVASAIEFVSEPVVSLKGMGNTEVYAPARRSGSERDRVPGPGSHVLIGRTAELAWLREGLHDAAAGAPVVMFIEADAGMGKSHLVDAFVRSTRADGIRVALGAAEPLDAHTPYGGLRFVVGPLLGLDPHEAAELRVERVRALFAGTPSALDRLPLLSPLLGASLPENALTSEMRGRARADALADLIVQLIHATRGDLQRLMVIDDAQWMDASSWNVLEQIVRRSRDLCVLLAARPRASFPMPDESGPVIAAARARTLQLSALAADDADGIIADTLGVPKSALPAALVTFLRERTQGQPLLVRQMVGALRESAVIRVDGATVEWDAAALHNLRIPTTVQGIVAARFDRLTQDQQRALKVASVFGRTFVVESVASLLAEGATTSAVQLALTPVVDAGLLRRVDAADSLMFEHALVRDAVFDLVPPARRRELHGAAAGWFERRFGDDSSYAGRIATHYKDAHDRANAPRALERAGELALKSGAYRESASAFDTLIGLSRTGFGPNEPRPIDATTADLARWQWKLGVSHYDLGALANARAALESAAALHGERVPKDDKAAGPRLIGDFARYVSGRVFPPRVRPRPDDDRARAVARILNILARIYHLNQLPTLTLYTITKRYNLLNHRVASAESMLALSGMTFLASLFGRLHLMEEFVGRVKSIQEAVDSPIDYADSLYPITVSRLGQGQWAPCEEESRESLEILTRLGERKGGMNQTAVLANLAEMCGDFARSRELYSELLRIAEEDADELSQVWALGGLGMIALREGDLAGAETWAARACVTSLAASETVSYLSNLGTRAGARCRAGDVAGARDLVLEGLPLLERTPKYATAHHNLNGYDMFAETAFVLIERGDNGTAVRRCAELACDRLRRYARTFAIGRPAAALWSAVEAANGGKRTADRLFDRAIQEGERVGIPFDLGRAHLEAARLGAVDQRAVHIGTAERIFERLGARVELERVRSLRA